MKGAYASDQGFSVVELVVAILLVTALAVILTPKLELAVAEARLNETRQDALSIGAAIRALQMEGLYGPGGADSGGNLDLGKLVAERTGRAHAGQVCDLGPDGSFVYRRLYAGAWYAVRYDQATGSASEVEPQTQYNDAQSIIFPKRN